MQARTVCQDFFSPLKSISPLSAVKLLLSSIPCNNGLKIKWNWKWKEQWKMTDLKGLYWNYGLLLRSESVSIIRFLAFTTNVKQLRAPFCVPVIKHALLLPSAVLQSIFDSSTWKWNERAGPNLHLYMALIFLKTKYFSAEMEQPLSKGTQKGTLFLLIIRATPVPPRNFLNRDLDI